jgi:hypothetical protein
MHADDAESRLTPPLCQQVEYVESFTEESQAKKCEARLRKSELCSTGLHPQLDRHLPTVYAVLTTSVLISYGKLPIFDSRTSLVNLHKFLCNFSSLACLDASWTFLSGMIYEFYRKSARGS